MTKSAIYVGTYGQYNNSSLFGKWFDLEDYSDVGEFNDAIKEYHKAEYDPEFMFQDWEGIPEQFISECSIDSKFWDYLTVVQDSCLDVEVFEAADSIGIDFDKVEDCYHGQFDTDEDLAYDYVESTGMFSDVPESITNYFNYKDFGRDLAYDYSEHNGHYFNNRQLLSL